MLRFLSLVTIFVFTGMSYAQAYVYSEAERSQLESGLPQNSIHKMEITHLEKKTILDEDLQFVRTEYYLEVESRYNYKQKKFFHRPYSLSKDAMTALMTTVCQDQASLSLKKVKFKKQNEEFKEALYMRPLGSFPKKLSDARIVIQFSMSAHCI